MDQNIKYIHQNMIKIVIACNYFFSPNGPKFPRPRQNIAKLPHFQTAIIRNFAEVILVLNNHNVEQPFLNTMLEFILT